MVSGVLVNWPRCQGPSFNGLSLLAYVSWTISSMKDRFSGVTFSSQLKINKQQQRYVNKNWTKMKLNRPTRLHVVVPICRRRICANWIFYTVISSVDLWVYGVALKRMGRNSLRSPAKFHSMDGAEDVWIDGCTRIAMHDSCLIRRKNSRRLSLTWSEGERNDSVNRNHC